MESSGGRSDEALRVVHVIDSLGAGGAERALGEMLPALEEQGIRNTVVCLRREAEGMERTARAQGVEILSLSPRGLPGRLFALRRVFRQVRPDLIQTTLFTASVIGRMANLGSEVPLLTSLVNTSYVPVRRLDPNLGPGRFRAVRFVDGWTARHLTQHFHAISEAVKESAVDNLRLSPEKVTVIPRGHDPERIGVRDSERRAKARADLGLGDADEVVVTLGRQEFQKGHRFLLEAAAALVNSRPHLRVLIAGRPGAMSGELRSLHARLRLGDRVRFLGHRADAVENLAAADVFVFPSLFEGLGNALLEAMGLGLPVVASDLPAIREVVEADRNAILVPPQDPAGLAAALDRMLSEPQLRERFGGRSQEIFLERFTLDGVVDRMAALYRSLAGQRSSATVRSTAALR